MNYRLKVCEWVRVAPDDAKFPYLAAMIDEFRERRLFVGPVRLTKLKAENDRELIPAELVARMKANPMEVQSMIESISPPAVG